MKNTNKGGRHEPEQRGSSSFICSSLKMQVCFFYKRIISSFIRSSIITDSYSFVHVLTLILLGLYHPYPNLYMHLILPLIALAASSCIQLHAQTNSLFEKHRTFQTMSEKWELDTASVRGNFLITPYKPVYITAGRYSDNPNTRPVSENPRYSLPFKVDYNNYESKFQLSFKSKVIHGLIKGKGDIWIAYTQKAHWQLYNVKLSRPFRELNYEPEVILNFATNIPIAGFITKMVGVSFNHQSNGRTLPLSRSWNRIVFHVGWERKNWQVIFRPWLRLKDEEDENPAILDYTGRGELLVVRNLGKHQLSMVGTHSFRLGTNNRGSIQLNWVLPVWKNLKAQLQLSDGYGETLQDYNHRQATIGVSVSLMEW